MEATSQSNKTELIASRCVTHSPLQMRDRLVISTIQPPECDILSEQACGDCEVITLPTKLLRFPHKRHDGFTQVELLTCLCVVVLILTFCLPAILSAQEAARRLTCRRNLKRLGLALHNYHDIYRSFPPGWVSRNSETPHKSGTGWMVAILPYLDQSAIYNQINSAGYGLDEIPSARQREALMAPVSLYRCPSDTTPEFNPFRGGWPTSNYSGNGGHRPFPRWIASPQTQYWPGHVAPEMPSRNRENSGLFGVNSNKRIQNVVDGTSNTIMAGERSVKSGAGIWSGVTAGFHENDLLTDGSHASRPNRGFRSFSSEHVGLHFLFADGSVQTFDPGIDSLPNSDIEKPLGLLQRLMACHDQQITNKRPRTRD